MKSVHMPTLNRDALKVLLVEDSLAEAELLQRLLLQAGGQRFFFTHVKSIQAAIEACNQEDFDVVFLDLLLPESKGLDTFTLVQESICQRQNHACPAIVVLTGDDNQELTLELIRAGAQDCLVKTQVESEHLMRSLKYAIARRDALSSILDQHRGKTILKSEEECSCIISDVTSSRDRVGESESGRIPQHSSPDNQQSFTPAQHWPNSYGEYAARDISYHPLDRFFTLSVDLLCLVGVDGYFKRLNPAWETTLGYSIDELLELPFLEFVHPEDKKATQRQVQKLEQDGTPILNFENRYICKNGSYRWFSWTAVPFDKEGLTYAIARDITEQKREQEDLHQSERRLRGYFENSLVGLVIITPDKQWIEVNDALCHLLGYSREELTKKNWIDWTHPDDLQAELEQLLLIFAGESDGYVLDKRFICKNGQVVYTRLSVRCIRRDDGACDHLIAVIVDISDRYYYEQQLRQAEGFLKHTLNAIADPIFVKDDQHRWVLINDAFCQLIGKSRSELMGKTDYDFLSKAEADVFWEKDELVFTTECEKETEEKLADSEGNIHILSTKKSLFENADGTKILVGTIRDVTNYKLLLEALQQSEARLNAFFSASPIGLCIFDKHLRFVQINEPLAKINGRSVCDHIGKTLREVLPELAPTLEPLYQQVIVTGEPMINLEVSGEVPSLPGVVRHWIISYFPIPGEEGRPSGVGAVVMEISDRKRAEERLRLLERAIAASSNGIVITDATLADHPLVYVNPGFERITGYSAEEVMGTNCRFLQGKDREQPALEQLRTALQEERECCVVLRNYRKDGSFFWNKFSISPVRNAAGELTHYIGVHSDITELKQAEAALQQQIMREQLVGLMRSRIRRTLNLQEVLTTAVEEVRQFLHADRTVIYRFHSDGSGEIVVESVGDGWTPLLGFKIQDNCFIQTYASLYQKGRIRAIDDIYHAHLHQCHIELLERLQVKANLMIPLLQGSNLWGLLIAHDCSGSRHWDGGEIECLGQLGMQLAIAIQQSTLFEQAQTEIAERKRVEESLRQAQLRERKKAKQLSNALHELKTAQTQLIQTEKMASLGQLVAGVAHEINNPTCFIYGNVPPAMGYAQDLLNLIALYQKHYPKPCHEIEDEIEAIELEFIKEDFPKLLCSMQQGASRIQEIVLSLRNFSRLDEAVAKKVDLHQGIESTLMMLENRLKKQATRAAIQVITEFGDLPLVDCHPGELNQVFMNILNNAIDAIECRLKEDASLTPQIRIRTEVSTANNLETIDQVVIRIIDNGTGISSMIKQRIFDPFFTTKPVGKGTGLSLSICHSIVVKQHKGKLFCNSQFGEGTEFVIELPLPQAVGVRD